MNLLKIIKKFLFIQNLTSSIVARIPPYLEFTVGKYSAIKKAMYITAHDKTFGSYLEFGVFTGSSSISNPAEARKRFCACREVKPITSKALIKNNR